MKTNHFFKFLNNVGLGRRIVEEEGHHLQSTAIVIDGKRSRGDLPADVIKNDESFG